MRSVLCRLASTPSEGGSGEAGRPPSGGLGEAPPRVGFTAARKRQKPIHTKDLTTLKGLDFFSLLSSCLISFKLRAIASCPSGWTGKTPIPQIHQELQVI